MNPVERGFVVPVWVRNLSGSPRTWTSAWLLGDNSRWVNLTLGGTRTLPGDEFHPRNPNRADSGDRPDLLEATS